MRTGEKDVKGLHTYKYKFMDNELDNGAKNPDNKCFCREGRCLQEGLIDVTDCYYGNFWNFFFFWQFNKRLRL